MPKILVRVVAGHDLKNKDTGLFGDVSDPFVQVKIGSVTHRTPTIKNDLNPKWTTENEFAFEVEDDTASIELECFNDGHIHNSLGTATVDVGDGAFDEWVPSRVSLQNKWNKGQIDLEIKLVAIVLHFDIITIGSGGGAKVSTPAFNLGYKVAMIEHGFDVRLPDDVRASDAHKDGLGGTCLNRGCIPSKMLIHPADVVTEIKEAARYDLKVSFDGVDIDKLVTRVTKAVDGDSASIKPGYAKDPRKRWFKDTARFIGTKKLQVGKTVMTADNIFLASGAIPQVPPIEGLDSVPYLTSTEALRLRKMPKTLIVIGAGYISVELGHYFGAMGSEVHMMARSKVLRTMDGECRDEFERVFSERYNLHSNVNFKKVTYDESSGFTMEYSQGGAEKTLVAEQLLVVTGVVPATASLNLEATGVELRKGGFVKVDANLRTSCEGIWAFGDCAGNYLFRHCANFEGEYLLEHVIHTLKTTGQVPVEYPPIDYVGMPYAVFSNPQVAGVGLTEEQCQQEGKQYVKGVAKYQNSAMGDARMSDHGFVKLLVEVGTRKILGCHIVGYEASTMIHQVVPLMRLEGKLEDLLYCIYIHPALNEILRNSARKARDALVEANDDVPLKLRLK
jgi:dihydrolipoamide dehydrogenase